MSPEVRARAAFTEAGYTEDDARRLAEIWNLDGDVLTATTRAGWMVVDRQALPVTAGSAPALEDPAAATARAEFLLAGYTSDDAVALARAWNPPDEVAGAVAAGQRMQAGNPLPVRPDSSPADPGGGLYVDPVQDPVATRAVGEFSAAGYTWHDAVALMRLWNYDLPQQACAVAALELRAGNRPPVEPGSSAPDPALPESWDQGPG